MAIRDRIKELRRVKASELVPHPENWREHPPAQRDALLGAITEIGYADALLARELPDGRLQVIDGHCRRDLTPDQEVPVLVLDLDEAEARKLLVTLDPLAAMAEANQDALGRLLHDVQTDSEGLQTMLDDLAKQEGIDLFADGAEELQDPGPQIDRAAELQKQWGTELGQLWEIPGKAGVHRLLCGDSTKREDVERVMGGLVLDAILTDPPYGVAYIGKTRDALTIENDSLTEEQLQALWAGALLAWLPQMKDGGAFYATVPAGSLHLVFAKEMLRLGVLRQCLVWNKDSMVLGHSDYHYKHEPVLYGWKPGGAHYFVDDRTRTTVLDYKRPKASREHPTMKPVALWCELLANSTQREGQVGDPFLGSGTTMVAAENLGRVCMGIEIEPKYVAVSLERLEDMGLTPRLCDGRKDPRAGRLKSQ